MSEEVKKYLYKISINLCEETPVDVKQWDVLNITEKAVVYANPGYRFNQWTENARKRVDLDKIGIVIRSKDEIGRYVKASMYVVSEDADYPSSGAFIEAESKIASVLEDSVCEIQNRLDLIDIIIK